MDFEVNEGPVDKTRYQDRAAERRATLGSDNPHQRDDIPSSVHRSVSVLFYTHTHTHHTHTHHTQLYIYM